MSFSWSDREKITALYDKCGMFGTVTRSELSYFWYRNRDFMHWFDLMTPIEWMLFGDIQDMRMIFLPEYKIGKYYADFACPVEKVVIEADGKQHDNQQEYDHHRDSFLISNGWHIYRVSGRDTFLDTADVMDKATILREDGLDEDADKVFKDGFLNSSYGVVQSINMHYGYLQCSSQNRWNNCSTVLSRKKSSAMPDRIDVRGCSLEKLRGPGSVHVGEVIGRYIADLKNMNPKVYADGFDA